MAALLLMAAVACESGQDTGTAAPEPLPAETPAAAGAPTDSDRDVTEPPTDTPVASESPTPSEESGVSTTTATSAATLPRATPMVTDPPTAASVRYGSVPAPMVEPDPDFQNELDAAKFRTDEWLTDFSLHTVPYDQFLSGGVPRDGIPPLDNPQFESIEEADTWLEDVQPVVALEINGAARAYPLAILTWHEIANDTLGGVPVSVTFCPLCNSAVAFDRRVGDAVLDFGVSGNLRHSDLVMWDRQTESWWQQLTGEGIVGAYAGYQLELVPAQLVSWRDFKAAFPEADVLSRETGYIRDYGNNPYYGYDEPGQWPFLFRGLPDERLLPMERVAALELDGQPVAFPFLVLERERVVHYPEGQPGIVVFFQSGTASALDQSRIADSRDVGATGVFEATHEGRALTFRSENGGFVDEQTGSTWNVLGQAVAGPLTGQSLTPVVHGSHFWFAWAAFAPETVVYTGGR